MARNPADLDLAMQLWNAGKHADADAAAQRVLAQDPNRAEALFIAGLAAMARSDNEAAVKYLSRAAKVRPEVSLNHLKLAAALTRLNRTEDAIASYRRVLELEPDHIEARNILGVQLDVLGRREEAIAEYRRVLQQNPDHAAAWLNLTSALLQLHRSAEALPASERAAQLHPNLSQAQLYYGMALKDAFRDADAIVPLKRAVELAPNDSSAQFHLAEALAHDGQYDEAIEHLEISRKLNPHSPRVYFGQGFALAGVGRLEDAVAAYRAGMLVSPNEPQLGDNLLFTLQFLPDITAKELYDEHANWARRFETQVMRFRKPHDNSREPDRRLRIGYVSADFRDHAQRFFLAPILQNHDRQQVEVYCYSNVGRPDDFTPRFKAIADHWREIYSVTEDRIENMIRDDKIDILIDTTMHMVRNRLDVFAFKPAPVQVTWLAYPGTTGLQAIDYRMTDPYLDPRDADTSIYSEETVRLPDTFWCYDAQTDEPASALPALSNRTITLGSLSSIFKGSDGTIDLWSRVMTALPKSRMIVLAPPGSARKRLLDRFATHGIGAERIEFVPQQRRELYLRLYHRIDLMLDTLPYNGHTTSLDAYYMGVPVVTLVGSRIVGRAGLSQLTNLKLTELVATTPDEFVRIAVELANDIPRLSELRRTLRDRMKASPLMDGKRFARNMEEAFRTMWRRWANGR